MSNVSKGDFISSDLSADDKNSWRTDQRVFEALNVEFNFSLDCAANNKNALCDLYLTKEDDALSVDWADMLEANASINKSVWCNPPYGRGMIKQFMDKAVEMSKLGVTTVFLVPATLEAKWLPLDCVDEIRIITGGRLTFLHPQSSLPVAGNTKGSMIVIFRPSFGFKPRTYIRTVDRQTLLEVGQLNMKEVG